MKDFDRIYNEHYRSLYCVAMKMMSDKELARDILQDVFISFYEINKRREEISNHKSYLVRATINKCIDYSSRERRQLKINGNDHPLQDKSEEGKDDKEVVKMALSSMNESDRGLLILYSEGYSYKEISEMLNINFNSVGKTLSRALKKMKDEIKILDHEMSKR